MWSFLLFYYVDWMYFALINKLRCESNAELLNLNVQRHSGRRNWPTNLTNSRKLALHNDVGQVVCRCYPINFATTAKLKLGGY